MQRESKFFVLSIFLISVGYPAQFLYSLLKADEVTATIMVSVYFIFAAIFGIIFSRLSDRRMKRKTFIMVGLLLIIIAFTGYYFIPATEPLLLILCSGLVGIAVGLFNPISIALFTEMEPTLPRGKLMSYYYVVSSAGWAVGMLLGGVIAQYLGYMIFIFSAIITVVGLCVCLLRIHDVPYHQVEYQEVHSFNNSETSSNLQLYSFLIVILSISVMTRHLCVQGGFAMFPNYMEALKADALTISFVASANMIMQAILMIPVGKLTDIFGRKIMLLIGIICSDLVFLAFSFITVPWILIFPQLLMGFAWPAMATSTSALVTDITTRQNRSRGMGWLNAGFSIGGALGPLIAGFILVHFETNFSLAFQILCIFPIVGILLVTLSFSENRTTHQYAKIRIKNK